MPVHVRRSRMRRAILKPYSFTALLRPPGSGPETEQTGSVHVTRVGGARCSIRCNPRLQELAQRVVGRELVDLKCAGALCVRRRVCGGHTRAASARCAPYAWRVCVQWVELLGCTHLAAGVAVLLGDPVAERLPIVRGAAGSDGWIGHGAHSDGADVSGRHWRRRRDALDADGRRPGDAGGGGGGSGGGVRLNPPRPDEILLETPQAREKAPVQEAPEDKQADGPPPDSPKLGSAPR
jgi:hypothetical protein